DLQRDPKPTLDIVAERRPQQRKPRPRIPAVRLCSIRRGGCLEAGPSNRAAHSHPACQALRRAPRHAHSFALRPPPRVVLRPRPHPDPRAAPARRSPAFPPHPPGRNGGGEGPPSPPPAVRSSHPFTP